MGPARTVTPPRAVGLTVAVVDDDPAVRRALVRMLEQGGLRAEGFASAEELLESGDLRRLACAVVDLALPGVSGPELLERIRAGGGDPAVIFVTGRLDAAQALRAQGLTDVPCLQKPFEPAALVRLVRSALDRPGTSRS